MNTASAVPNISSPEVTSPPIPGGGQGPTKLTCLLCRGTEHSPVFNESGVDILQCAICGHIFSSFPANPHYDEYWGNEVPDDQHFYWSLGRRRMHGDFFKKFIVGRSGRLLDMGCGLGFFVKAMGSHTGWEAYGCEISPAAVKYSRTKLGLEKVACSRLEKADFPPASFDIITLWDVIDHIPQPDPMLTRCYELLRPGGMCFLRTPNVSVQLFRAKLKRLVLGMKPEAGYLMARDHAHHYSRSSIRKLLERNGFTDIQFVHLHPIETATGVQGALLRVIKNTAFQILCAVSVVTGGRVNFDNLFVVARKRT